MKPMKDQILTTILPSRALVPFDPEQEEEHMRTRRRKTLLFRADQLLTTVVVAGVIALVATSILTRPSGAPAPARPSPPLSASSAFVTAPVRTGDLLVRVAATGTVEPERLVDVSTELSGTVIAVHVDNNDVVKAGQLLAELDSETLRKELARAAALVTAARANLKEAEVQSIADQRELDRKSALAQKKLTPQRELDQARAEVGRGKASMDALRAELAVAEANYAIAEAAMKKSRILSPVKGIILRRNVEPGQTVAASLSAPVLFRLAQNLDRMQIRVDVDEADALQVKDGQAATFGVQALRDQQFQARVEKLFVGPEIVQGVVTYKAILRFDNRELRLKPGMTASAEIIVHDIRGKLLVPNVALRFSPPDDPAGSGVPTGIGIVDSLIVQAAPGKAIAAQGQRTVGEGIGRVFVVENGRLEPVFIKLGATDGTMTEVVSGPLQDGQHVVIDLASRPQ